MACADVRSWVTNGQANPLPLGHRAIKPCRASVSGSPTEEVEEAAALLAYEAQGLGEPVRTPYEPPESQRITASDRRTDGLE